MLHVEELLVVALEDVGDDIRCGSVVPVDLASDDGLDQGEGVDGTDQEALGSSIRLGGLGGSHLAVESEHMGKGGLGRERMVACNQQGEVNREKMLRGCETVEVLEWWRVMMIRKLLIVEESSSYLYRLSSLELSILRQCRDPLSGSRVGVLPRKDGCLLSMLHDQGP